MFTSNETVADKKSKFNVGMQELIVDDSSKAMRSVTSHAVNFLYKATGVIRPDMGPTVTIDKRCDDCGQYARSWVTPFQGYIDKSSYGIPYVHCEACESLYAGSIRLLGVERTAKGGAAVSAKWGMMASMALLVEPNRATLIGTQKTLDKLPAEFPHRTIALTGRSVIAWLLNQEDLTYPLLFIRDLGRKKAELIRNLQLSSGPNQIFLCDADGKIAIDSVLINHLLSATAGWPASVKKNFIDVVRRFSSGELQFTDDEMKDFRTKFPEQAKWLKLLPVCPHERIATLQLIA